MAPVILFNQTRCHRANNNISNNNSSDYSEYTVDTLLCPNSTEKTYHLLLLLNICGQFYVMWQWNMASEEKERVDTSAGWDEND